MKLGDGVEVAIHCVATLAGLEPGAAMPASALADFHGVSQSYLLKHLAKLTDAEILTSASGPSGGYQLARPADRITLADIVVAVEGQQPAFRCAEIRKRGGNPLPDNAYPLPCGINRAMLRAERVYRSALAEVRLSDIVEEFVSESDPRVIARGCAFLEANQRRRK
ncbi:Rrf2 family transcriptional regulator [uncultured Hoeflea sp.]|uniref:RrF2 family transcriptional regulator n=1 Tax=uncultured Hoeflea sp. TaxID=538666 RepID=UPI00261BA525|nr:Rrf2 family transcriptional regulator [uncultured Hoeflea sp.]